MSGVLPRVDDGCQHGSDLAVKLAPVLAVYQLPPTGRCGAHIPEQLLGALALRLRLEEAVQRRQGAGDGACRSDAPQSQYRCLSRAYVKWDLPWSDHVLSECKGTTQMAVSRRSGQRGKREEPIGPFSSSPSGSGERTLNVKTMLPTVTSQKIADVVQHRPGRSATRSPQAADAGLLDHDRQLPCRPASRRGRVGLSTSGFDPRLESRDGPRRWISR
jgi:hypothetical protein